MFFLRARMNYSLSDAFSFFRSRSCRTKSKEPFRTNQEHSCITVPSRDGRQSPQASTSCHLLPPTTQPNKCGVFRVQSLGVLWLGCNRDATPKGRRPPSEPRRRPLYNPTTSPGSRRPHSQCQPEKFLPQTPGRPHRVLGIVGSPRG